MKTVTKDDFEDKNLFPDFAEPIGILVNLKDLDETTVYNDIELVVLKDSDKEAKDAYVFRVHKWETTIPPEVRMDMWKTLSKIVNKNSGRIFEKVRGERSFKNLNLL